MYQIRKMERKRRKIKLTRELYQEGRDAKAREVISQREKIKSFVTVSVRKDKKFGEKRRDKPVGDKRQIAM